VAARGRAANPAPPPGTCPFAVGARLRNVQTGYLRSYVLFLVLAAVGIFVLLSYLVAA